MRAEWAGVGVNLRTSRPSIKAIKDGVDKINTDASFKARCMEIQQENEKLEPLAQMERLIAGIA